GHEPTGGEPAGPQPEPRRARRPHEPSDAQRLAAERGIAPDPALVRLAVRRKMTFGMAVRYVMSVRTNVALIVSGALGYYFLAGIQTFGVEFVRGQYGVDQVLANLLLLVVGGGAVIGVLAGGPLGDALLHRGRINGRVMVATVAAGATVLAFIPALLTHSAFTPLPYVIPAAVALSAQNPPIHAARPAIMPPRTCSRAPNGRNS